MGSRSAPDDSARSSVNQNAHVPRAAYLRLEAADKVGDAIAFMILASDNFDFWCSSSWRWWLSWSSKRGNQPQDPAESLTPRKPKGAGGDNNRNLRAVTTRLSLGRPGFSKYKSIAGLVP